MVCAWSLVIGVANGEPTPKERLEKSPRHHEWVEIKHGDRVVHAFLVYPEVSEKATAVVVIHENRGLTDWERGVADQLAEAGFIAIAPDLLSGSGPGGGKTSDFPSSDAAREAIYKLKPDQVTADLKATTKYVSQLPAANGKVAVAGFCWGGGQSFRFATNEPKLAASFVFYGTGPDQVDGIQCPVYGFYGGNDNRVNATIPKSEELMKQAGKRYDPVIYPGAGHGFMRAGELPDASAENKKGREEGWKRWREKLSAL
ncbi:MAG: dienelactone hydrolase family protein [Planctomycetota bacterium]